MQLARYQYGAEPRLGLILSGTLHDLADAEGRVAPEKAGTLGRLAEAGDMKSVLALADGLATVREIGAALSGEPGLPVEEVTLLNPLPDPGKVLCLAGNYYEGGAPHDLDKTVCTPRVFSKPNTSLIGPGEDIRVPPLAKTVVPEIELAVVIGRRGRDIPAAAADEYICAYTIFNDFSARELDLPPVRRGQPWDEVFDWLNGKWFDTFGAVGPTLTLKEAVPHPEAVEIVCRVNGQVRDQGNTRDMIFTPAEIIAFISQITTLEPGDLIATGVAIHAAEEVPIQSGDVIEGEVEGLGVLRNRAVRVGAA